MARSELTITFLAGLLPLLALACSYSAVVGKTLDAGPEAESDEAAAPCPSDFWQLDGLCAPRFESLCSFERAVIVEGASASDNSSAKHLADAIVAECAPTMAVRQVANTDASVSQASTGRPITGPGELLIAIGGPDRQPSLSYLQGQGGAFRGDMAGDDYVLTSPESGFAGEVASGQPGLDLIALQMIWEPRSQTSILSIFGQQDAGNAAGVLALISRISSVPTDRRWWFTTLWEDQDGDLSASDADAFVEGAESGE